VSQVTRRHILPMLMHNKETDSEALKALQHSAYDIFVMLSVTNKPFMLNVFMLSVIMQCHYAECR
jgi:hypothetical protein